MSEQALALRLANLLETDGWPDAAAELRRLHSVNAQLLEALEEMLVMWEDDPSYGSDTADKGYAAVKAAKGEA